MKYLVFNVCFKNTESSDAFYTPGNIKSISKTFRCVFGAHMCCLCMIYMANCRTKMLKEGIVQLSPSILMISQTMLNNSYSSKKVNIVMDDISYFASVSFWLLNANQCYIFYHRVSLRLQGNVNYYPKNIKIRIYACDLWYPI